MTPHFSAFLTWNVMVVKWCTSNVYIQKYLITRRKRKFELLKAAWEQSRSSKSSKSSLSVSLSCVLLRYVFIHVPSVALVHSAPLSFFFASTTLADILAFVFHRCLFHYPLREAILRHQSRKKIVAGKTTAALSPVDSAIPRARKKSRNLIFIAERRIPRGMRQISAE